jgi:hypothetical protein
MLLNEYLCWDFNIFIFCWNVPEFGYSSLFRENIKNTAFAL